MRRGFWVPVLFSLLLAGCRGGGEPRRAPEGLRPDWGALLPEGDAAHVPCAGARWTPARADLDRLEAALAPALEGALERAVLLPGEPRPAVGEYYRQYAGCVGPGGRRVIDVNGLRQPVVDLMEAPGAWRRSYIHVDDGGLDHFGARFDAAAGVVGPVTFGGRYSGPVTMRRE